MLVNYQTLEKTNSSRKVIGCYRSNTMDENKQIFLRNKSVYIK